MNRPLFAGHTLGDRRLGPILDAQLADNARVDAEEAARQRRARNDEIVTQHISIWLREGQESR